MQFPRLAIVCFLAAFLCALPAMAQEKVTLRGADHDGYSRLVFDWPTSAEYSLSKDGNRILLRFGKAGVPDLSGVNTGAVRNLEKIEALSQGAEPLQMAVTIPAGSRFRDFRVQSKVVLDVYDAPADAAKPEEKLARPVEPAKTKTPVKPADTKAETKKTETQADVPLEYTLVPSRGAPPPATVAAPAPAASPASAETRIVLTSTQTFGLAAFFRAGYLWIVTDNPQAEAKPVLSGAQESAFGVPEPVSVEGGLAWRYLWPENIPRGAVRADGERLGWRVIVNSAAKDARKVVTPVRGEGALLWPLPQMRKALKVHDPLAGDDITVVTALHSDQFASGARDYIELEQLDSVIGLAFIPRVEDIAAQVRGRDVIVTRPGGLSLYGGALHETVPAEETPPATEEAPPPEAPEEKQSAAPTPPAEIPAAEAPEETPVPEEENSAGISVDDIENAAKIEPSGNNIYNFKGWEMGGIRALGRNMRLLMLENAQKDESARAESFLTMAKLNLASNQAAEALGLLRAASEIVPPLESNADFKALRGAAATLSGKYDVAFGDMISADLEKYDDVKLLRAYTLAGLEDWKQAITFLPANVVETLANFPPRVRMPIALVAAEIALRGANVKLAENILDTHIPSPQALPLPHRSAHAYLKGEAQRQLGNNTEAMTLWKPLVEGGRDHLYRAKAGLSLTKLQLDLKQIKPPEAIHRLEGLRYAWRGDELETLVNFRLGQVYVENNDFLKGLTVLRYADSLARERSLKDEINTYMRQTFRDIFANNRLDKVTPLEAISLYEEFKDLSPSGDEGDRYVEALAERLVNADLLGRAASMLEYQVNNRLKGDKKAEIAIRLAAIRLLDGNAGGALRALEIAQAVLNAGNAAPASAAKEEEGDVPAPAKPLTSDAAKQRQINLLKARALSMEKKTDEALAVLDDMRLDSDVNRLRADISWGDARWDVAADAFNDLIVAEQISPRRALNEYQTGLILNRAIALNLADNRVALANLRQRHKEQMDKTAKGQLFDVVSRPRRPDMIGSRQSIENMISEISLFQEFLDGYKKMVGTQNGEAPAPAPAPVAEETPAETATPPASQ